MVPPRPKPGRKPATDEPASKRKAQNRESQRAFRARKAAKLNEMQAQVETTEQRHKQEMNKKVAELHARDMRINQLEALVAQLKESEKRTAQERDFWKDRAAQDQVQYQFLERQWKEQNYPLNGFGEKEAVFFQTRLSGSGQASPTHGSVQNFTGYTTPKAMDIGCGNCKADGECACIAELAKVTTPNPFMTAVPLGPAPPRTSVSPMKGMRAQTPFDVFAEREIDFTAQFASKRMRQHQRPSIAFLTQASETDSNCGFCTDESNCLCKDESLRHQELQRGNEVVPASHDWTSTSADVKLQGNDIGTNGPGSCPDCQANPRQRAWCQRVAQLKNSGNDHLLPSPTSRTSSISGPLETMEPHIADASTPYGAKQSIGCSEAYKLLEGRVPMDQDKMDWIGNLKPVPPAGRRDTLTQPTRKYSALELDTAGVIATLGSTMQPLQPRPSDGENAHLVRIAQEYQRSSSSPQVDGDSPMPVSMVNGATIPAGSWR